MYSLNLNAGNKIFEFIADYASEFKDPPNLTFTDNTDLIFSATPSRPRVEQFLAATSAAKRDSLK